MSQKFPKVTAAETIKVIERVGFVLVRQSGSHMIYKNKVGKRVTIPFHDQKILHPKILKNILCDAELSVEEFLKLMR
jgi:predicted RNA binding protein YcfA (HicA-like mRNA interferase family)